jgi:hypothetical protein
MRGRRRTGQPRRSARIRFFQDAADASWVGQLAATGAGGLTVAGVTIYTGWWMLALAAGVVFAGILVTRVGFRRRQSVGEE